MQPNFDALYRALVTSNLDTTNSGKIRVQCPQLAGTAEIRSAEPVNPLDPIPAIGSTVWIGFSGGDITKPFYFSNSEYLYLGADGTTIQTQSLRNSVRPDGSQLLIISGSDNVMSGANGVPHISIRDTNGDSDVDLRVSGAVVNTNMAGTVSTWQTPSYKANWSAGAGFNGLAGPVLRYRMDAEDNVWLYGTSKAATGAGTTVFTLPSGYYNTSIGGYGMVGVSTGSGTPSAAACAVDTSGNVVLTNVVANSTYMFNFKCAIGNIS